MALQPVSLSNVVIPVQNQSIMTVPNTDVFSLPNMNIGFPQPNLNPLDMAHSSIDTFNPVPNRIDGNEALSRIPINVANLELLKTKISEIDIDVPRTLQIITPHHIVDYYEHYYGDVTVDYLQPNELTSSVPSPLDKRILPIELGRNTTLDFIGFDEGMAFIVTNGTSPENVVIAENMADEDIGYSVLLSLNENSDQNVELIQSSNIQLTPFSIDIPYGLSAMEVGEIVTDISEKTETIQIVSPDFVTDTSSDDQTIFELGLITGFARLLFGEKETYLSDRFGSLSPKQILSMLENPVMFKERILSIPITEAFTSGTFLIAIHGRMISYKLVDVDCSGIDQLSFIGRNGLVLSTNRKRLNELGAQKANANFYPTRQTAVGQTCRVPELKFNADTSEKNNGLFGLFHINEQGQVTPVLTKNDFVKIFGNDDILLSTIINLAQIMSGGSQHVNLHIAACMSVHPIDRKVELTEFRISNKPQDIPHFFKYEPQILVSKEVPRVKRLAPDRFCRVGAEQRSDDPGEDCFDYLLQQDVKVVKKLDPHEGLSGEGIREALSNKDLIPDVFVVFPNDQKISAKYFNVLLNWHTKRLTVRLFDELNKIGIRKKISLSDIIPEINEVFSSLPANQPFGVFLESLKTLLIGKIEEVNKRVS
jgi:hypothetical protein